MLVQSAFFTEIFIRGDISGGIRPRMTRPPLVLHTECRRRQCLAGQRQVRNLGKSGRIGDVSIGWGQTGAVPTSKFVLLAQPVQSIIQLTQSAHRWLRPAPFRTHLRGKSTIPDTKSCEETSVMMHLNQLSRCAIVLLHLSTGNIGKHGNICTSL